jgi:hypothetical protein
MPVMDPVFVLCMGRPGSTLLRLILDTHPDLAYPPGTSIPALCAQLAVVWSLIEGAPLSLQPGGDPAGDTGCGDRRELGDDGSDDGAVSAPAAAHPASSVAALTSYWAAHTTQQLESEHAHPQSCLRVRIEDLSANLAQAVRDVGEFVSVDTAGASARLTGEQDASGPAAAGLPLHQIPASLLAHLSELHRKLGYPSVSGAGAQGEG